MPESVHLCDFPLPNEGQRYPRLEQEMQVVMKIVQMGRQLRADHNLKVRQPLSTLHVVSVEDDIVNNARESESIIKEELNVKTIRFGSNVNDLTVMSAKPDFKKLGPRFGAKIKSIASFITKMNHEAIEAFQRDKTCLYSGSEGDITLQLDEIIIEHAPKKGLVVATEGDLIVGLETELTEALIEEGHAREFISKVQNIRKDEDYDVTQRIHLNCCIPVALQSALNKHSDTIQSEVLAVSMNTDDEVPKEDSFEVNINGHQCYINIKLEKTSG